MSDVLGMVSAVGVLHHKAFQAISRSQYPSNLIYGTSRDSKLSWPRQL